jgi:soluble lytic murein transglycosylase-like protein
MFRGIFTLLGAFMLATLTFFYFETQDLVTREESRINGEPIDSNSPASLQMYYFIEKYAEEYEIPKKYAYGIAWKETRYNGPFHWSYNPAQTSFAGAVGPMQIMPSTAAMMWRGEKISKDELKTNIELNVRTSMKLLRYLKNKYRDWKVVFGAYNTGYPMVNQYAIDVYNFDVK